MTPVRVTEKRVKSFDGTEIAYHVAGDGPPVLLANGLGGSWKAWTHQIGYLQDRYRFISWDYRGLYRSGPPPSLDALDVVSHARDAEAVLAAEGIDRVAVLGWSMGVQVGLELFRRRPELVASLALVSGVAGRPWETVGDLKALEAIVPKLLGAAETVPGIIQAVTRRIVSWPETVPWAKRIGLAAKTLDDKIMAELSTSFRDLDMGVYVRILNLLGEHDAWDVLDIVDVPTLVVTGDRDLFTPKSASERMVARTRGAEILVVAGATHYLAIEFPELLGLRLEKFWRERGYPPRA